MIEAEITGGFTPLLWALGLLAFPGVLLAAQWVRVRRGAGRLHATGPVAHLVTLAGFVALTVLPEYNRAIDVTGDAAVIFVGTSMLPPQHAAMPAAKSSPYRTGCCVATTSSAAWSSPPSTSPNAIEPAAVTMARLTGSSAVLLVADIERSVEYYRDRLGFTCEVYGDPPDFIVATRDEVTI